MYIYVLCDYDEKPTNEIWGFHLSTVRMTKEELKKTKTWEKMAEDRLVFWEEELPPERESEWKWLQWLVQVAETVPESAIKEHFGSPMGALCTLLCIGYGSFPTNKIVM
jgi:hypothetical protein